MKKLDLIIKEIKANKANLKNKFNVENIGLFGSFLRGEQTSDSDLDVLVNFSRPIGLLKFIQLERYLSALSGNKVDLVMQSALKPRIGKRILAEVKYI